MEENLVIWSLKNQELVDLLISREGGKTTVRILDEILKNPTNANQLSKMLELNYKTIIHHTNIMQEHKFITRNKFNKTYYFHPTEKLIKNLDEYYLIKKELDKRE
ncbi:winged helix-turn-helix domain-containing protein [Methanobrevibacter sp.]|uniref:winged helix-turn-helix domain-containing protein n=1 Tax=Methanobrevibacter sp. TaxID=66852 RepID=UPI0025EFC719|nr:winged helix-turn-helix domain-containing protein [Methanobrevibacter sp.]MBQ2666870.1 winged helix-turn-helix transcriptional regulator [Methanobrevibacter sp.]